MSLSTYWSLFKEKWTHPALPITLLNLTGRTVIVTGANVGLGLEAAKHFYSMGPSRLILAVRSLDKGEAAKKAILQPGKETKVEVWQLDLGSFESTKAFANRVNTELGRLDVFLANAGMATAQWSTTKDGWESTLQTNVLSTYLLAALLIPILKRTAKLPAPVSDVHLKPHLVIVSSGIHFSAKFVESSAPHILSTLNDKSVFASEDRYSTSKILEVFLTREMANSIELKNSGIVTCSVNPGFCRSELMREFPMLVRIIMYSLFARTTEAGSRPFLWASLADNIPSGSYTDSCRVASPAPFVESAQGAKVQKKLWKELEEVLIKVAPETESVWKTTD